LSSTTGVLHDREVSVSFCGGDVHDDPQGFLTRSDSSDNLAMLSTSMALAKGSREHGRLEKRNTSCTGGTIGTFPGEGISCPRSRRWMVDERRGTVCARCFGDTHGCPGFVDERSSCGLIAEKSNGPLGCLISGTRMWDSSGYKSLVN